MSISTRVKIDIETAKIMKRKGLGESREVQRFLASEVERLSQPYVPFQTGVLQNSAQVEEEKIIYPGPYAHYQYTGEVMGGTAPKHYTGKAISYHGAPMRGKKWEKRMIADRIGDIESSIKNYIRTR